MRKVWLVLLVMVLCLAWAVPGWGASVTIRLAHELGPGHPKYDFANNLKKLVDERLKGKVEMRVYPQATLFKDVDALDAVQAGNLEMAIPLVGNFAKWVPETKAMSLPNLTPTAADADRLWNQSELGKFLKEKMKAKGIVYLGYTLTGGADGGIMTRERIVTLAQIKGKKIRIHSPDAKPIVLAWGASPIAISAAEIGTALQRGTIDGAITSAAHWSKCCQDLAPYFTTRVLVVYTSHVLAMNKTFYDSLDPQVRTTLQQCVDEAAGMARKEKEELDKKFLAAAVKSAQEKGVYVLTDTEAKPWDEANYTTYSMFKDILGQEVYDLAVKFIREKK